MLVNLFANIRRALSGRCALRAGLALALLITFFGPADPLLALTSMVQPENHAGRLTSFETESGESAWLPIEEPVEDKGRGLVLLIHGLDEIGTIWDALAPAIEGQGYEVLRFDYANDQAIADSAEDLDEAMARLRELGIEEITIVAHSMGGLVTMDAISRDVFDPARWPGITRVITLGTPAKGSALAPLRPVMELREHAARAIENGRTIIEDGALPSPRISDGQGQAGRDLAPGSPFLTELWTREVPSEIPMTAVVARADRVDETRVREEVLGALPAPVRDTREVRGLIGLAARWASKTANDLSASAGDGVVSVESARSAWTDDIVEVRASHRSMVTTIPCPIRGDNPPPAIAIILDRLEADTQDRADN